MSVNPNPKQEIFIEEASHETRVALLEDGVLQELFIERAAGNQLLGNIYKAKVERVVPGMQAAFVKIGEQKSGFLGVKNLSQVRFAKVGKHRKSTPNRDSITSGEKSLWVQVSKDPYADKGARLTTELSISGTAFSLPCPMARV